MNFTWNKYIFSFFYSELLEQTQAAHLVTILSIVYLAFKLFPDSTRSPSEASTLTRLIYVATISTVFGSQIWMTFVSGMEYETKS